MIEKIRFWCNKVLPAVYDDSLSYYEVLCKIKAKLNEVIDSQNALSDSVTEFIETVTNEINVFEEQALAVLEQYKNELYEENEGFKDDLEAAINQSIQSMWNNINDFEQRMSEDFHDLSTDFTTLYNYVHNYLDNLDFNQAVEDTIEDMVEDGSFAKELAKSANIKNVVLAGVDSGVATYLSGSSIYFDTPKGVKVGYVPANSMSDLADALENLASISYYKTDSFTFDECTDVVILNMWSDTQTSTGFNITPFSNAVEYAATKFKNAKIWFAPVSLPNFILDASISGTSNKPMHEIIYGMSYVPVNKIKVGYIPAALSKLFIRGTNASSSVQYQSLSTGGYALNLILTYLVTNGSSTPASGYLTTTTNNEATLMYNIEGDVCEILYAVTCIDSTKIVYNGSDAYEYTVDTHTLALPAGQIALYNNIPTPVLTNNGMMWATVKLETVSSAGKFIVHISDGGTPITSISILGSYKFRIGL